MPAMSVKSFVLIAMSLGAICAAEPDKVAPANRLARETSPYLRQHANNPVDWYPWGPDALAKAQKENKLIFLSVGYSSCHWCHVMERESFMNDEVAKLLNESFVCIKVDREERPDIDQIYQAAAQVLLRGQPGGWPLTMFLLPDGKPIAGSGIYLPPEDRIVDGRRYPGLKSFIRLVLDAQRDNPKEVKEQADDVARVVSLAMGRAARSAGPEPRHYLVTAAVDALKDEFDAVYGGFGNPRKEFKEPKFPMAPALQLLVEQARTKHSDDLLGIVTRTLDQMAQGGIYDQLGGGFHRYSTERSWTVPHFEKTLSDNAQLVDVYTAAYRQTKNPLYCRVVEETLAFVGRELTSPDGGFFSALDADSESQEGRFYVWTAAEIEAAVPDPAERTFAKTTFGIDGLPPIDNKYYVLTRRIEKAGAPDARLAQTREKLFAARSKRARPFLDSKVVTAWNGQMIAAYAVAGKAFEQAQLTATAVRVADFLLAHLRTIDGRLLRTWAAVPGEAPKATVAGYLDDYASLTHGLLCLHDATGDARWLSEAKALTDLAIRYFADEAGGFYFTANDHEKLFARSKDAHDGAQPSGNSVMALNLIRLAAKTGESKYRNLAAKTLRAFTTDLEKTPMNLPMMALAVNLFLAGEQPQPPAGGQPAGGAPKRSDSVVKATATSAKPGTDGKQVVTVKLVIEKGWHVYGNPVGNPDLESAKTSIDITGKAKPKGVKVDFPKPKLIQDNLVGNYQVYEGTVEIKATVERAASDEGPLQVTLKFQSCNQKTCLLPATVKLSVP
jgi:uncharacterized protein YyaL (SSP411 family)